MKLKKYFAPALTLCIFTATVLTPKLLSQDSNKPDTNHKWEGVDKGVVEKFAEEHGRKAHVPFINTDRGDLLLFVFLLAGSVGGFIAGYYWRMLMTTGKAENGSNKKE